MIKIYTPSEWNSYFKCPCLIIDDNHIYSEQGYNKMIKSAIGNIDRDTGCIYEGDYRGFGATPIGQVKVEKDVTMIYGSDYYKFGAKPILYIKDNKVYDDVEYFRLFSTPSGYLERTGEIAKIETDEGTSGKPLQQSNYSSDVAGGMGIIIFVFIVLSCASGYGLISGAFEPILTKSCFIASLIGSGVSLIRGKKFSNILLLNEGVSSIAMWLFFFAIDYFEEGGFTPMGFFIDFFLGLLASLIFVSPLVLVSSVIIWLIKKAKRSIQNIQ